jgi:hypothetical protein
MIVLSLKVRRTYNKPTAVEAVAGKTRLRITTGE